MFGCNYLLNDQINTSEQLDFFLEPTWSLPAHDIFFWLNKWKSFAQMDEEDLHKSARLHIKGLQLNVKLFVGGKCWKRSRLYVKPKFTGEGLICKFKKDFLRHLREKHSYKVTEKWFNLSGIKYISEKWEHLFFDVVDCSVWWWHCTFKWK